MAAIGLKYPMVALYDESAGTPTYKSGMVMAKAIKVDLKWTKNDAELYADDALDEADTSITGGTETLGINDLTYEVQALILGHKYNKESNELVVNENDVAPYVGHGFYGKVKRNGVEKFRAIWLCKMMYSEPDETLETKGEKTSFNTPSLEGKIMKAKSGDIKMETIVDTEAEAIAWLKKKAGIAT
jgi:phi13 family phage major tail protein